MCDPATATLVITAAATTMQLQAQEAQVEYQNKQNAAQYRNAMLARASNLNQTNMEMVQEREGAMQKLEQNNLRADASKATATVAAGENGVSGLSVGALLDDLASTQGRYNSSVAMNYDRSMSALESQRINVNTNAANVISSLKTPASPDYAGAALRIAGAYNNYSSNGGGAKIGGNRVTASYYDNPEF